MEGYRKTLWGLFALFLVANMAYLHRVPGLLGDEASEGENVYELLTSEDITVTGERSYIGPAIDYLRVPFVGLFGYSVLALRVPMLLFSIATFWLAAFVLRKQFGDTISLFALTFFAFAPQYILYQRLGWAITLFPFLTFSILWLFQQYWKTKWVWIGLAAGLGLANHILFLPTLVAIGVVSILYFVVQLFTHDQRLDSLSESAPARLIQGLRPRSSAPPVGGDGNRARSASQPAHRVLIIRRLLLLLIGFWAGFGMQFAVLQFQTDDQGDPSATTQLFSERVTEFISAAPLYLSGSSYIARYTGVELAPGTQMTITAVIFLLGFIGLFLNWKKPAIWAWAIGIDIHLLVMLYMVDRFTLRYFVVYVLGAWLLAGIGVGSIFNLRFSIFKYIRGILPLIVAVGLALWVGAVVLVPFLQTGGSTNEFSLGNRTNSAAAFVDVRPLVECVRGIGPVFSENVHIWNRLQYLSHQTDIDILREDEAKQAQFLVEYQEDDTAQLSKICPNSGHFTIK